MSVFWVIECKTHNPPQRPIKQHSLRDVLYGPMLSKSIISPPLSIVLQLTLCALSAFKYKLREKSSLPWNELT